MYEQQVAALLLPYHADPAALEKLTGRIAARLEQQPCPPPANVAGQVLDAARWADDAACETYAALLAASMDAERRAIVHPAFAAIIGQLDETEGRLLRDLQQRNAIPTADCYLCRMRKEGNFTSRLVEAHDGAIKLIERMTDCLPADGDYARVQAAIDNLLRLRLVELHMHGQRMALADIQDDAFETLYMLFEQAVAQAAEDIRTRVPAYQEGEIRLRPGNITLTEFGKRFVQACLW